MLKDLGFKMGQRSLLLTSFQNINNGKKKFTKHCFHCLFTYLYVFLYLFKAVNTLPNQIPNSELTLTQDGKMTKIVFNLVFKLKNV